MMLATVMITMMLMIVTMIMIMTMVMVQAVGPSSQKLAVCL
jgi:hypothetical protein